MVAVQVPATTAAIVSTVAAVVAVAALGYAALVFVRAQRR